VEGTRFLLVLNPDSPRTMNADRTCERDDLGILTTKTVTATFYHSTCNTSFPHHITAFLPHVLPTGRFPRVRLQETLDKL
jgi:hypothetical protein